MYCIPSLISSHLISPRLISFVYACLTLHSPLPSLHSCTSLESRLILHVYASFRSAIHTHMYHITLHVYSTLTSVPHRTPCIDSYNCPCISHCNRCTLLPTTYTHRLDVSMIYGIYSTLKITFVFYVLVLSLMSSSCRSSPRLELETRRVLG